MQTRSQRYAAQIFAQVNGEVKMQSEAYQKKYGSMAHKLPVLIRTAGLAQALSFVESRGETEHKKLLNHLAAVTEESDLAQRSRAITDLNEYMRLTREVLSALLWYKRFAQSVLKISPGEDGAENP
jgi:CRISPR-associated protein Cmr5